MPSQSRHRDVNAAAIDQQARELLERNHRTGIAEWSGTAFDFTCPSIETYPFQWFWDSCFHAIVLARFDVERAKRELRSLVSTARPDGFIGHIVYWEIERFAAQMRRYAVARTRELTTTIQPPVLAQAVERIWQRSGDLEFVREMLPVLWRFHRWLLDNRDPDRDGLLSIIQPDESGMDASPRYDRLMQLQRLTRTGYRQAVRRLMSAYRRATSRRPVGPFELDRFAVEDVAVNAIFAEACASLSRLSIAIGATKEASEFEQQGARTTRALIEKCWDAERGLFFDLAGAEERPERVATVASLMPLILPDLPRAIVTRLVEQHLLNPQEFWPPFPVPSVALNEPSFIPGRGPLWRGATWINTNWWLACGLSAHGYGDAARDLAGRSAQLVARSGFREYYNPFNATGYGARGFAWSTLVVDMS